MMVLGALMFLGACGSGSATNPLEVPAATSPASQQAVKPEVLTTIDGQKFDLAAELKVKPVAFWFWAPG